MNEDQFYRNQRERQMKELQEDYHKTDEYYEQKRREFFQNERENPIYCSCRPVHTGHGTCWICRGSLRP